MNDALAGLIPTLVSGLDRLGYLFNPVSWLGHVLLGTAIQVLAALPLRRAGVRAGWWLGAALSIGFWWGRKKMEFEFMLERRAGLHTDAPFWWRGWLPVEWSWPRQLDLYAPALSAILLALLIDALARRRAGRRG